MLLLVHDMQLTVWIAGYWQAWVLPALHQQLRGSGASVVHC
jgi:hypothetical protein